MGRDMPSATDIETVEHRFQQASLDHVVPVPQREMRQPVFDGFGVRKDVRLIGSLIHSAAADFGQQDWL